MKLVLAIAGASGSIYPARFLKKLFHLKHKFFKFISLFRNSKIIKILQLEIYLLKYYC